MNILKNIEKIILILILLFYYNYTYAELQPKIFSTNKNIKIILLPDVTTDLVSVSMAFKGAGSKNDIIGQEGLAFITMQMLWRSPDNTMDRNQRSRKIKELGVISGIDFNLNQDNLIIEFKCPEENLIEVFNIINNILINAKLEDSELSKIKNFSNAIKLETASELEFAKYALENKIFLTHPYGIPNSGSPNSVQTLNIKDVSNNIINTLAKDNLIISVVGNLEQAKIKQMVEQVFAKLPDRANLKSVPSIIPKLDGTLQTIIKNSPQSGVAFALHSPNFKSKDFYPMLILNRILGTAFTGRLWTEIREKHGLAYQVGSYLGIRELSSVLLGYLKCANKDVNKAIDLVKQEIQKLKISGITEQELKDAKSGTIGAFALNFITTEQTSEYLLSAELLGISIHEINNRNRHINSVTLEQVNKVADKYLNINELTMVLVGDPVS